MPLTGQAYFLCRISIPHSSAGSLLFYSFADKETEQQQKRWFRSDKKVRNVTISCRVLRMVLAACGPCVQVSGPI